MSEPNFDLIDMSIPQCLGILSFPLLGVLSVLGVPYCMGVLPVLLLPVLGVLPIPQSLGLSVLQCLRLSLSIPHCLIGSRFSWFQFHLPGCLWARKRSKTS